MPTFIDHHDRMELTPEMEQGLAQRLHAGQKDENGVKAINLFLTKDGGAFCLLEAPDAEAVVRTHADGGTEIKEADVVEVRALV